MAGVRLRQPLRAETRCSSCARERGGHPEDPNKANPLDFVLWQPSAPGEPAWDSPWGQGRPGWHIECSALALRELGTTVDLHGGGSDLIFPHHECEATLSGAVTGQPFVRHWVHAGMVGYEGTKMSKSLGNLVFVRDLLKIWEPAAMRLAVLAHHYRSDWEWHDDLLQEADTRLTSWREASRGGPDAAGRYGAARSGGPGAAKARWSTRSGQRSTTTSTLQRALAAIDAAVAVPERPGGYRWLTSRTAAALLGVQI